jgi:molybdopterin-synthase adenylyltransferase
MANQADRFDRSIRLFGAEGQSKIGAVRLGVVGCGGLGSFGTLEAAYLGVRDFVLIDPDVVTASSLNRLVGAAPADVEAKTPKVEVGSRVIRTVDPHASIEVIAEPFQSGRARAALSGRSLVLASLDDDLARLQLAQFLSEWSIPSFDLATEISRDGKVYGGRVTFAEPGRRCVYCLGELDKEEMALASLSREQRRARDASYGVGQDALGATGASVVSLNGVVASLALTELMVLVTGLRAPALTLRYLAHEGQVHVRRAEPTGPCVICARDPG